MCLESGEKNGLKWEGVGHVVSIPRCSRSAPPVPEREGHCSATGTRLRRREAGPAGGLLVSFALPLPLPEANRISTTKTTCC